MREEKRTKAEYRSSIRSKQMIKEALLSLMIEKHFDRISITDIVKKADINRGTFYAHYANTSDVLKSISMSVVDEIASAFSSYNASSALYDPEKYLSSISLFLMKNQVYYAKLLKADRFYDVLTEARHAAIKRIIADMPAKNVSDACPKNLTIVLDYCISGIMTIYQDILLEKIPISLEDSNKYISELIKPQKIALIETLQQIQK